MKYTKGEKLMLARRRMKITQVDFAEIEQTTVNTVCDWESDEVELSSTAWARVRAVLCDGILIGEQCQVLRRRSGKTIRQIAKMIGCSHLHVIKMERDEVVSTVYRAWLKVRFDGE